MPRRWARVATLVLLALLAQPLAAASLPREAIGVAALPGTPGYAVTADDAVPMPFVANESTDLAFNLTRDSPGLTYFTVHAPPAWQINSGISNGTPMRVSADGSVAEGLALHLHAGDASLVDLNVTARADEPEASYVFTVTACDPTLPGHCVADMPVALAVDGTPPVAPTLALSDDSSPTPGWTQGRVTLSFSNVAPDIRAWSVTEDATPGDWTDAPPTEHTFAAPEGAHTLHAFVRDRAGNVNVTSVTIGVDLAAPVTSIASGAPVAGKWLASAPTAGFAVDDGAGSGAATTTWSTPTQSGSGLTTAPLQGEGSIVLSYHSTDRAGRVEATKTATYHVDLTPPVVRAAAIPSGWLSTPPTVNVTVTDALSGVASAEYEIVAGATVLQAWTPYAGPFALDENASDVHVLFDATDAAGNANGSRAAPLDLYGAIDIDQDAPGLVATVDPSAPASTGWFTTTPTLTLTPTDGLDTAHVSSWDVLVDGAPTKHGDATTLTLPDAANATVNVTVADEAGNAANFTLGPYAVDTVAPDITASLSPDAPASGWYADAPTLTLSATDATSGVAKLEYRVLVGGAVARGWATYDAPVAINVSGAAVAVETRATDVAGNVATRSLHAVSIDLDAPTVTATLAPAIADGANGWYVASPTLTLAASDASSPTSITYTLGDGDVAYATPFDVAEGDQNVTYWATDAAGHASGNSTLRVRVDLTAPTLAVNVTGADAPWSTRAPHVSITASDALSGLASCQYRVTDGASTPVPWTACAEFDLAIDGAALLVTVRATDAAGNVATATRGPYAVDLTDPSVNATTTPPAPDGANGWFLEAPTLTLTAAPHVNAVAVQADAGAGYQNVTGPLSFANAPNGTIAWRATDAAGRSTTSSLTVKFDAVPPLAACEARNYYLGTVVVMSASAGASGVATYTYSLDGGAPQPGVDAIADLTPTHHVVIVNVTNGAGVAASATCDFTVPPPPASGATATTQAPSQNATTQPIPPPAAAPVPPDVTIDANGIHAGDVTVSLLAQGDVAAGSGTLRIQQGGLAQAPTAWADDITLAWAVPAGSAARELVLVTGDGAQATTLAPDQASATLALPSGAQARAALVLADAASGTTLVRVALVTAPRAPLLSLTATQGEGRAILAHVVASPADAELSLAVTSPAGATSQAALANGAATILATSAGTWTLTATMTHAGREVARDAATVTLDAGAPQIDITPLDAPRADGAYDVPLSVRVTAHDLFGDVPVDVACEPACVQVVAGLYHLEAGGQQTLRAHAMGASASADATRAFTLHAPETLRAPAGSSGGATGTSPTPSTSGDEPLTRTSANATDGAGGSPSGSPTASPQQEVAATKASPAPGLALGLATAALTALARRRRGAS